MIWHLKWGVTILHQAAPYTLNNHFLSGASFSVDIWRYIDLRKLITYAYWGGNYYVDFITVENPHQILFNFRYQRKFSRDKWKNDVSVWSMYGKAPCIAWEVYDYFVFARHYIHVMRGNIQWSSQFLHVAPFLLTLIQWLRNIVIEIREMSLRVLIYRGRMYSVIYILFVWVQYTLPMMRNNERPRSGNILV